MTRNKPHRRGVLLLVVLGMLAMFGLIALTFVMISGRERENALAFHRIEECFDPPDQLLHAAAIQCMAGSLNPASAIRPHGILEDLYGTNSFQTRVGSAQGRAGGQLLEISLQNLPRSIGGCVLTMFDPQGVGHSRHVVGISPGGNPLILALDDGANPGGWPCLVNGSPFSGMGFGYDAALTDPAAPKLSKQDGNGLEYALLPNPVGNPAYDPGTVETLGGMNEDYDGADYQTMFLAGSAPPFHPSFHRPDLCAYWKGRASSGWPSPDLLRKVVLRPLPSDHPLFTGSNPAMDAVARPGNWQDALINGPWDVDNDGDRVADSIWLDLGMPVRATADGKLYKPLFAFLVRDMESRLNVNAHGCLAHLSGEFYGTPAEPDASQKFASAPGMLPRGGGWGPAEVNLGAALPSTAPAFSQKILCGANGSLDGRYGESAAGAVVGAGTTGQVAPLSFNKLFDYPVGPWNVATPGSFSTPPDLKGSLCLGLDLGGQPVYSMVSDPRPVNHPYQLDLSRRAPGGRASSAPAADGIPNGDNLFSVNEWERLARPNDRDALLQPARLATLAMGAGWNSLAPVSEDLPCPAVVAPPALRANLPNKRATHLTDLLRARGVSDWTKIATLLPPEFLAGMRMDLNRPFGNGKDDNGNGVVDEPGEIANEVLTQLNASGGPITVPCDVNNNGSGTADGLAARQLFARHLYVLLMLLVEDSALPPWADPGWDATRKQEERARWLAQWAVNVVDFRDADSIMTPFPYDPAPFASGGQWSPPGDDKHIVWGCERPELLLSETVATQDIRTEDLANEKHDPTAPNNGKAEGAGTTTDTDEKKKDQDFDSRLKPEGSLFVELFNPWLNTAPGAGSPALEVPPGELYAKVGDVYGVDLTRCGGDATRRSPVWRIAIRMNTGPADYDRDPDDPNQTPPAFDRAIYFVNPQNVSGIKLAPDVRFVFYPSSTYQNLIKPVLGGRYALVGPDSGDTGKAVTYLGFRTGENKGSSATRQIVLEPAAAQGVRVLNNGPMNTPGNIQPAVAVVINHALVSGQDKPLRLSVSEPADGYPATGPDGGAYDPVNGYPDGDYYDVPLDKQFNKAIYDKCWSTEANYCTVYLQRLANPLAAHDAASNPYRTIDKMPVDLSIFNGAGEGNDPDFQGKNRSLPNFSARERGESNAGRNLWMQEQAGRTPASNGSSDGDHIFKPNLQQTFGYVNRVFGTPAGSGRYLGYPSPDNTKTPFPWLTWNNRPLANQYELLMVPHARSSTLPALHGMADTGFPHLPNFLQPATGLFRLLDFVHVPSRFTGAELIGEPNAFSGGGNVHPFHPPFNRVPYYREPGRVNLNTATEQTLTGVTNLPNLAPDLANKIIASRQVGYSPSMPSLLTNPFRSSNAADLVPLPSMINPAPFNCTPLRMDTSGSGLLLSLNSAGLPSNLPVNNVVRNPYFFYQMPIRLGGSVTARSNVFAVWVTVGYFEVAPGPVDPVHPDGYRLGRELNADTGDMKRHRAFYIIDRTIPVGFERGKTYNVEDAILLRRFVE